MGLGGLQGLASKMRAQPRRSVPADDEWFAHQAPSPRRDTALMAGLNTGIGLSDNGTYMVGVPEGMIAPGNIDLAHRPTVHNPDGSISTVRSITVGGDNGSYLLPTVVGNRVVSNDDAIKHWQQTGEYLGAFDTEDAADAYAQSLHEEQAGAYLPKAKPLGLRQRGY